MTNLDLLEENVVSAMHYGGGGNPLGSLGQPETPLLVTPGDKRLDCWCRGGVWAGTKEFGVCVPGAVNTGKHFDKNQRGCVPLPGVTNAITPSEHPVRLFPWWRLNFWWLVGGVAVTGLVIGALISRR